MANTTMDETKDKKHMDWRAELMEKFNIFFSVFG